MGTAVDRGDDPATADFFHHQAYVGAVDFRHKFMNGMYELSGSLDYSTVRERRDDRADAAEPDALLPAAG
jgi:hypothetical protein